MSPKTSEMRKSSFLKQDDVGSGLLGTITGVDQQNVAKEGADQELKWCLNFKEVDKPLVLNSTNIQLCERICGSDNTDDWVGHQIVLYVDPNVSFGGKLTGGIRIRAPKGPKAKAALEPASRTVKKAALVLEAEPLDDDSIPF